MFKIGANIYFKDLKTAIKNVENLANCGYDAIYFDGDFFIIPQINEIKEISKIISNTSLIPFSAHTLEVYPELNEKPENIIPYQEKIFEKAKILGVKYLTCHFGYCKGLQSGDDFNFDNFLKRYNISLNDYRKKSIDIFKILCERAKQYNIFLTIENLPLYCLSDLTTRVEDILGILNEINCENIGICFDSGHANIAGLNLYEFCLKAGEKLVETHFHDNFSKIGKLNSTNDLHQICGIGNINWIDVISGLEKINFKNPVVFEIGCSEEILKQNKLNFERFYNLYKEKFPKWPIVEK